MSDPRRPSSAGLGADSAANPSASATANSPAILTSGSPSSPPLRLLIADDEPPARARLRRLLAALPGVEVVGEAGDGLQALAQTEALAPDGLLLDVQMPLAGGLDVAASLATGGPPVVFVTAFDRYALEAFEHAAVDYLLKPVDPDRLARAVQRLRERRRTPGTSPAPARLLVVERGQVQVIELAQVQWLQAADNYVQVHAGARSHLLRRTLEALLQDVGPAFVRIHRSHAVAVAAVRQVDAAGKGDASVLLASGERLPCSRGQRAALMQALSVANGHLTPAMPGGPTPATPGGLSPATPDGLTPATPGGLTVVPPAAGEPRR